MSDEGFYGADLAAVHHAGFGELAAQAADLLIASLRAAGHAGGVVADLGCGSGLLAKALAAVGYGVVGVDVSAAMLELARAQAPGATFVRGSLFDVELPRSSVAVAAVGEALNYAVDERAGPEGFEGLLGRVREALAPGGVFLFDVATPGRYGRGGVGQVFHDRPGWALVMRARESVDGQTLHRHITLFRDAGGGLYRRSDEHHRLRLFDPGRVTKALKRAGFGVEVRDRYDASSRSRAPSGWHIFVAKKA
ncbi:MAG TPA: class I SAM-dependent methyltransferase [Polyangiaceae bacterium]|nr:class I SAM-dependent methyltransferase [Polyangiaceae bacterium]